MSSKETNNYETTPTTGVTEPEAVIMKKRPTPVVNNWYQHLDKGLRFEVVAIDEERETIEIQYIDGDLDEIASTEWEELQIAPAQEPENFSGPYDVGELDDYGTEITDTSKQDWDESFEEIKLRRH
jgi:hypothetical protein